MIEKFDPSKDIVGTYQGIEINLTTNNDTIIFSPTKEIDLNILASLRNSLQKEFPKQKVIVLPFQMTIQVIKESEK